MGVHYSEPPVQLYLYATKEGKMRILLILLFTLFTGGFAMDHTHAAEKILMKTETLEAKDFSYLFGELEGISEEQLKQHNELYKKYVSKYNEITKKLKTADKSAANQNYSEYRSLSVELSHNQNGAVLHELYFSNLTDNYEAPSEELIELIEKDFGSWENYIDDLRATAESARAGWAITAYNYRDGKIYNYAIDQHNLHVPVIMRPILVLDTWEHAFMIDYGIDKKSYIDAFFDNVNWEMVYDRLNSCLESRHLLEKATM